MCGRFSPARRGANPHRGLTSDPDVRAPPPGATARAGAAFPLYDGARLRGSQQKSEGHQHHAVSTFNECRPAANW